MCQQLEYDPIHSRSILTLHFYQTRRLLAPAFRPENLRTYLTPMLQTTNAILAHWAVKSETQGHIDLQEEVKQLSLRLAFSQLLGATLPPVEDEPELAGKLDDRYKEFLLGILPWPLGGWYAMRDALRARERMLEDVVAVIRKRKDMEAKGMVRECEDPLGVLMSAVDENGDR